jgi:hypothetical protein
MGPVARATGSSVICWIVAVAASVGVTGCFAGKTGPYCPGATLGRCGPPFEMTVGFKQGVLAETAETLLKSCADANPVVIRIGSFQRFSGGIAGYGATVSVYTHSNSIKRVASLRDCLGASGLTEGMGFPD